jgi:hypothetical protein
VRAERSAGASRWISPPSPIATGPVTATATARTWRAPSAAPPTAWPRA